MRFALSEDQGLLQDSITKALADLSPLDRVRKFADGNEETAPDTRRGFFVPRPLEWEPCT